MTIVTKTELCNTLGYSDTTITKFMNKGMPIVSGGGKGKVTKFDTVECIKWLIQNKVSEALGGEIGEDDLKAVNMRKRNELLDLQIQKESIAVNALESKLYPSEVVEDIWSNKLILFKTSIEALVPKLAFLLTNITTQQDRIRVIDSELNLLLSNLSERIEYTVDSELFKDMINKYKEELQEELKKENEDLSNVEE